MKSIKELAAIQEKLDKRIIADKNIDWTKEEMLFNTLVSLDVELAEMANEAQWFKVWKRNPKPKEGLLEEYVDALHFFLSIANQKGWVDLLTLHPEAIDDLRAEGFELGLNGGYAELKFHLFESLIMNDQPLPKDSIFLDEFKTKNAMEFKSAWFLFLGIGLIGFGFKEDQIFRAYLEKNEMNHQRQDGGY